MVRKSILSGLVFGGFMLATALALKYAAAHHLVSGHMPMRGIEVLTGLMLAFFGNVIPKNLPRFRGSESGRVQSLRRTCGWLMTLAGLGYAAVWAAVPYGAAAVWSMIVVGSAVVAVLGYAFWVDRAERRAKAPQ
jgi:4-hydroxybenzoate polyprenyltransferase